MWHPDHLSFHDHTGVLLQYAQIRLFSTSFFHLCLRYAHRSTPDIVSEVLHVPRVAHPDYPGCDHLRTMSKDELSSLFYETPSSWGDRQNTPCLGFAKGPRFLNMVMTFVLHPLSHHNSITEPRTRFCNPSLRGLPLIFSLTSFYPL